MPSLQLRLSSLLAVLLAGCAREVPEPVAESPTPMNDVRPTGRQVDETPVIRQTSLTASVDEHNGVEEASAVTNNDVPVMQPETPTAEPTTTDTQEYPAAYYESPKHRIEGPDGAVRITFDDLDLLKLMNLEDPEAGFGDDLPQRITGLHGKRVRFRAFMMPPFAFEGLTGFLAAKDNELCCFGRAAKIYDVFPVELRASTTTRYIRARPFDVVGTFHVAPDVELEQLYYVTDAVVIE